MTRFLAILLAASLALVSTRPCRALSSEGMSMTWQVVPVVHDSPLSTVALLLTVTPAPHGFGYLSFDASPYVQRWNGANIYEVYSNNTHYVIYAGSGGSGMLYLQAAPGSTITGTAGLHFNRNGVEWGRTSQSFSISFPSTTDTPDMPEQRWDGPGEIADFIADPVNPLTGEFVLHETDLSLSTPLPIRLERHYGSHNKARSPNFGIGWSSSLDEFLFQSLIAMPIPSPPHSVIQVMDENGSVHRFISWVGPQGRHYPVTRASTTPPFPATTYIERIAGGLRWTRADGSNRYYVNKSYPLGSSPWERPYLDRVVDAHGNTTRFLRGEDETLPDYGLIARVESSAGPSLVIERRADGLIERVSASDGRQVDYNYENGYLSSVTTADGTTTFDYDFPPGVTTGKPVIHRITQPEGRILENDYDVERRVIAQRSTVDPERPGTPVTNATFAYHADRTDVTDAYGRTTRYHLLAVRKRITRIEEPLARDTHREWYPWVNLVNLPPGVYPEALKKTTDSRGLVTEFKYDNAGNITETKITGDLDGDPATPPTETHIVTASYDAQNLPEWSADSATGLNTEYFYEDPEHPRLATRVVIKHTASGQVLRTDKFDYTTRSAPHPDDPDLTVFARGLLAKRTLALGSPDEAVTDFDYDATGFRISEIRRTGTTDPDVSFAFTPTARRELHTLADAAGRVTSYTYDDASRPLTKTVQNEHGATLAATATAYNAHGERTRLDGPRPGAEDWIETDYDQAGRPSETRVARVQAKADGSGVETPPAPADQARTTYHHDFFGNLALVIDPRGHATTHQYDALGRLTHTRLFDAAHAPALLAQYQADQLAARAYDGSLPPGVTALSLESFTYEPGGKVETHTDVLGGQTTTFYNSRGQPRHRTHPDGSVLQWRYHPDGRLAREILRNGAYWQIDYDDLARTVTRTLKKTDGAVLATETRVFDRRGNLVSFTDAEGHAFTTTHDALDRVKIVTGPASAPSSPPSILAYSYDDAGILTVTTNALGEKTLVTRDALGRATREEIRDAHDAPVRITTTAFAADHRSATVTHGTGAAAIATTTYPDPQGRPLLVRFGDGTYRSHTYDLGGFPHQERDPLGRLATTTFDALGHLATRTEPDTHLTTFVHNPAGQLLERRMPGPQGTLVAKTVYDQAGRPVRSSLLNGAAETRVYEHAYHPPAHPLWAGLPDTVTDPRGVVSTFAYDDFLRVQSIVTDGSAPEADSTTAYAYDRRGLLTQLVQTAPANGPPTIVSRPRDAYGRVTSETLALDGATFAHFDQRWDAAGRRTRLLPEVPALPSASTPDFNYRHRADGAMSAVSAAGFSATFHHADNGLLTSRQNLWRVFTVAQRDPLGRPLSQSSRLPGASAALQTESLLWRADGTLDHYAVARSAPGAWDESRAYAYDDRARLTSEGFSPAPGQSAALAATFDHGAVGLGIRTDLKVGSGAPSAWQSRVPSAAAIDAFSRVTGDETNAAGKTIPAHGVSLGADFVELWVNGGARGRAAHPGWADNTGAWSADLPLDAGAQTLETRAAHPSGRFVATATSEFTVSVPLVAIASTHDAEGNVTSRTFGDGRVQMLTWDAFNRLVRVTERDTSLHGYDWSAIYDGLGRRLRTVHQPVVAGAASGAPTLIDSLYDPEHEFLEIAVIVNGEPAWKVHGPDLDGRHGGWNGTGGLEAVLTPNPESANGGFRVKAIIADAFGNVIATVAGQGSGQRVDWLATRVGGYGPLPNQRAELLTTPLRLAEASAWRNRRLDPTGFFWLGARYYEPHTGRFLSPDPYGHGSDLSLYAYANGDPVNRFDPDGRFGKDINGNPYGILFHLNNGQLDLYFDYLGNTGMATNLRLNLFDDEGNPRFATFEDYRDYALRLMGLSAGLAESFAANIAGQEAHIDRMLERMFSRYDTGLGQAVTTIDLAVNLAMMRMLMVGGPTTASAERIPTSLSPNSVNFSQRTVSSNVAQYADDMAAGRWDWSRSGPLRVMETERGWVSYDNRRLLAAQQAGLKSVPVQVVRPGDMMSPTRTWADAFTRRFNDPRNVPAVPPGGLPTQPTVVPLRR